MTDPILRIRGLEKYYESQGSFVDNLVGRQQLVRAVDGVNLDLNKGETLGVVGESGCGKTTLGRAALRLIEPTGGSVEYIPPDGSDPIELTDISRSQLRDLRKDIQYIFQDPFSSLNPRLTVGDIIGEPLDIHGLAEGEERQSRIYELLDTVGLNPSHAHRYPHEFSGGQRQRIGIARALAVDPEIIVCDEPVSALDVSIQAQILNLLTDLQEEFDLSYMFIAHDLGVVKHISDRVAVMYLGEIAEVGDAVDVFERPKHPYTEALLSVIPEPDPRWEGEKILLRGEVPSPLNPPSGCRFHPRCHRIIQPAAIDLSQATWRAVLDFKLRVREASDPDELVLIEGMDEVSPQDPGAFGQALRTEFDLPETLSDSTAESTIQTAIDALEAGDLADAEAVLDETFASPCESDSPHLVGTADSQEVSCLLYEDESGPVTSGESAIADD